MKLKEQIDEWASKAPSGVVLILTPPHLVPLLKQRIPGVVWINSEGYMQDLMKLQHETITKNKQLVAYMPTHSRLHRAAFLSMMSVSLFRNEKKKLIVKLLRVTHRAFPNAPLRKEITLEE